MFWIWFYNFVPQPRAEVARSGPWSRSSPTMRRRWWSREQVQVAPSGLALPVVGVKAGQLVDTFDDARAAAGGVMTPSTSWPPKERR